VAGHSLGEFSALVAAGALSFEAGLLLVARRAEAMQRAADARPGSMSSVLGLSAEGVEMAVEATAQGQVLAVANDNAPGNVVVSGEWTALERLPAAAKELGAKRVVPLNVGGAFHSPLMAPAVETFQPHLAAAPLRDPSIPVVANATAEPVTSAEELRELLARQLTGRVRWTESVRRMAALGVDTFIEVGPGTVLSGLIKRSVEGARILSAANAEGVAEVADALRAQADGDARDAAKADVAKGEDQGEVVVLPERFAVSPGHGRFYPVTPPGSTTSGPTSSRATCSARSATAPPASPSAAPSAAGSWPISPGRASWSRPARSCSASGPSDPPTAVPPRRRKEPSCPPRSLDLGWPCRPTS
jgi:[acyl-carrier-protein] S-malonyltransferase